MRGLGDALLCRLLWCCSIRSYKRGLYSDIVLLTEPGSTKKETADSSGDGSSCDVAGKGIVRGGGLGLIAL